MFFITRIRFIWLKEVSNISVKGDKIWLEIKHFITLIRHPRVSFLFLKIVYFPMDTIISILLERNVNSIFQIIEEKGLAC